LTVYKKQDIPDRYHLKNHYRVPPLYLLADEGYVIIWVSNNVVASVTGLDQPSLVLFVCLSAIRLNLVQYLPVKEF